MESFFTRYKNAFVLILVLLAQAIGLATQVRSPNHASRQDSRFVHALRASMAYIITPPERLFLHIGHGLRAAWFGYIDLRHTRQQNADLKQQLDQLRMRNLALTEDARQGQRLQALLAFKQQYVGSTVTAQVIGTSGSDQSHVLFLDKGANDGLKPDMAVITPDGIVGKLRDVDATTSQLLLINDASSGAGVILETTRTRGVLRGTAAGILQIGTLLPDDRIKAGEHVLTSGGDRVFPRGLSVGNVESIALDPEHPPFTAIRIHPSANLARLEEVLIVTNVASQIANSKDLADSGTQKPDAAGDHLPGLKDLSAKPDPNQPPLPPNTPAPLPHPKPIIHPDRYTPGTVPPAGSLTPGGSNGNGTITSSPSKPKPQSNPENNEER